MNTVASFNELSLWETSFDRRTTARVRYSTCPDGVRFAIETQGIDEPLQWSAPFDALVAAMEAADAEMDRILWGQTADV